MAVSPQYARSLVGQWVDCQTPSGMRTGILREVRPDGIVLDMQGGNTAGYADGQKELEVEYADQGAESQQENVFFRPFFNPFFFIPFFLLLAIRRRRFFI
ncbi:DUF2642 domain-containing protein [Tumebacillus lipolyticus]|uniref:DUF2642 domain-containing protein n=1 Tax=Tumebacillus lipolyticus TaxID=1280370 RepID=A0ABW4ZS74_9BACL